MDVTLVDRKNHHLFQPLLYQAAAGALSPSDCASPIRPALKHSANTTVLMAEVTDVDVERRQVVLDRGDRLDYDSLIVACGGQTSYFGHDEWQDVTCGLKTLADVVDLRQRFYGAFEQAERTDDPAERAEWLTFVVVGGGPTGVEIAGQLAITARAMRSDLPANRLVGSPGDPARRRRSGGFRFQPQALEEGRRQPRRARCDGSRGRARVTAIDERRRDVSRSGG